MKTHAPDSTNVALVRHDETCNDLTVKYKDGSSWNYRGVTPEEFEKLIKAKSIGSHLREHIQKKHPGKKL